MKKLIFGLSLVALTTVAFAGNNNDAKNASPAKSETKTQALMYWFDANTGQYIGHSEESGCDLSTSTPCALGYSSVSNPNNPQKPNTAPQETETGVRP